MQGRCRGGAGEIQGRSRLAEDVAATQERHCATERLGAHLPGGVETADVSSACPGVETLTLTGLVLSCAGWKELGLGLGLGLG